MTDDELRSIAFARRLQERVSTSVEPFPWGWAYFDDEFPRRYGSNFLWVEGSPEVTAGELAAEADRMLGGAGFEHRVVLIDPRPLFDRLRPGFADLGWSASEYVMMVLRNQPTPAEGLPAARRATHAEVLELLEHHVRAAPYGRDENTVRTLAAYPGKLERRIGAAFFVAEVDGVPAATCELYLDGADAQVESVQTLPDHRGRGLGSAVVRAAVEAAQEAGAEWIHLYAEADDWPAEWYRRLGFEPVGFFGEFALYPNA